MGKNFIAARNRRKKSVRKNIFGTLECPRMSIFRSNLHVYAQLIDDVNGKTILSLSSNSSSVKELLKAKTDLKGKKDVAFIVGEELGKLAKTANIAQIVFDRNGYLYHGRVKALADGARNAGIKF